MDDFKELETEIRALANATREIGHALVSIGDKLLASDGATPPPPSAKETVTKVEVDSDQEEAEKLKDEIFKLTGKRPRGRQTLASLTNALTAAKAKAAAESDTGVDDLMAEVDADTSDGSDDDDLGLDDLGLDLGDEPAPAEKPNFTADEVNDKLKALLKEDKALLPEVKKLFAKYEIKQISDLDESKFNVFVADVEKIGKD